MIKPSTPSLTKLIAKGESATLELKRSTGELRGALQTLCAFANGKGVRAAGLKNPDISILSDQFLAGMRGMQHKNLATVKESVRAKPRVIAKRILRKHGYPPDKQETATNTVLQQAELLSDFWTEASA